MLKVRVPENGLDLAFGQWGGLPLTGATPGCLARRMSLSLTRPKLGDWAIAVPSTQDQPVRFALGSEVGQDVHPLGGIVVVLGIEPG